MKRILTTISFLSMSLMVTAAPAQVDEAAFLQSLSGNWSGEGSARRTAASDPIGVSCQVSSQATDSSFALDGTCRAMAVIRQTIAASLDNTDGANYEGVYTGPAGGQSGLSGARSGDVIDLEVAWAADVNGDRTARMQVEKSGDNAMVIRTIDTNPENGQEVVTSEINLTRN